MSEISRAETGPEISEGGERSRLDPRHIGEMILDGLMNIKERRGEMVPGMFSYLSPVPKEFNMKPFKLKLEPIIKLRKA